MKLLSMIALVICSIVTFGGMNVRSQDVRYNYLPGTDFSKYKTFRWVTVEGHRYPSQLVDAQIKQAIESQLVAKGMTESENADADLYVTYQVAIDQQQQWNAYGGGFGWRRGMGTATATSSTINIGTLVLDFYDVATKQQIWSGSATKQLNPSKDPAKNQKNLNNAMAKLLKNFPPLAK